VDQGKGSLPVSGKGGSKSQNAESEDNEDDTKKASCWTSEFTCVLEAGQNAGVFPSAASVLESSHCMGPSFFRVN
jgi:hypothetical protein